MRIRAGWAIPTAGLILASAFVWLPNEGAVGQIPTEQCTLADPPLQPEEPLEMNTVVVGRLFKTVVMEKEVFVCLDPSGAPTQIADLETFIEIVERAVPRRGVRPVEERVEVAKCVKDFAEGIVRCEPGDRELTTIDLPLEECLVDLERPGTPSDPVVMNTETSRGIVKTVKVEKEVLTCGNLIGDLYMFTEIIEAPDNFRQPKTLRPIAKRFEGVLCLKDPVVAEIRECRQFIPFSGPG
jgi:hypothetical protein